MPDAVGSTAALPVLAPERFVAGGEALARAQDGKVVFVRGGVPGDTVRVAITESKKDWARGHVQEVVESGQDRVVEPCPARTQGCGGCDWQMVAPESQLGFKTEIVADAMRRTAKLPDASIAAGASVTNVGYRTTIRIVGGGGGRPAFRTERSNEPVAFGSCLVAHPTLNAILDGLRLTPGLEVTLRVSAATGGATARWDTKQGELVGLPEWVATGSNATLVEEVVGHQFVVSASSFFQSGPEAAGLLIDTVQRIAPELTAATTVVDAYAGVGLFAVAATNHRAEVITIESGRAAVEDSVRNLAGRRVVTERSEVARWTPPTETTIDVVIADPSRTGLGKPGVAALVKARAPVFVLVSCDPVALARDTALLADRGYRHVHSEVLDLFPHTHHVEAVTRFERSSG